jgi:para-nitrobenzyl esterase
MKAFFTVLFCIGVLCAAAQTGSGLHIVKTTAGVISGGTNQEGNIHIFRGIPFAAPPVGALRWKAPQPAQPWTGVRKCNQFGPSPMQPKPAPFSMWSAEFLIPEEPISEDCLYLNVWSGASSNSEKRPVLVWIYGGGFNSGGSAVPIYDGEAMAKDGIVFVSFNYRVGPFGFFAHPELTKESGHAASGNYGLMDQIAALKWVQQNIAQFGGNPGNITIAGQSAGAMSVNCLVASPLAAGLFQKAIAQSGGLFSRNWTSLEAAEAEGAKATQASGYQTIEELRKLSAEDVLKKLAGQRRPIVDGYVMPAPIVDVFAAGKQAKVALLAGWNEEEGLVFGPIQKKDQFREQMVERYSANAAALLKYYPAESDSDASRSQYDLSRDMLFGAHGFAWANMQASQGLPVYMYRFTRKVPGVGAYAKYGAFHTGEVPYAYNNLRAVDRPWQAADRQLAATMSAYWVNFIKTGNPNGGQLPQWPAYTENEKQVMILGDVQKATALPDVERLRFLYSILK